MNFSRDSGIAGVNFRIWGTFIQMGAVFDGTLKLSGDFRIDNEFRGELKTDGTVIVGPAGSIQGNIIAHQVEVEGGTKMLHPIGRTATHIVQQPTV